MLRSICWVVREQEKPYNHKEKEPLAPFLFTIYFSLYGVRKPLSWRCKFLLIQVLSIFSQLSGFKILWVTDQNEPCHLENFPILPMDNIKIRSVHHQDKTAGEVGSVSTKASTCPIKSWLSRCPLGYFICRLYQGPDEVM